ncbi:MAG: branched-chain amino acid ABC transporter permease [Albidovulum sp.]|nr:branched-chain amino acid ABC transporter permease [Albidovulum sp.]MDE0306106.1 branched-chain amino acid ABC transporter permease [Albidovulum sp.]
MTPEVFVEVLINGIAIGSVYALFALGLALIFGVLEFVNFAHGEFYMIGAMLISAIMIGTGVNYWLALPVVVMASLVAGVVLYDVFWRRLRQGDYEKSILITIGIALILQNGALYVWGPTPRLLETGFTTSVIVLGDLVIPVARIVAMSISFTVLLLVYLGLNKTRGGLALRGVAQNRAAATMVGIQLHKISRVAVGVGIGLCGLSGGVLALIYTIFPTMGYILAFKAFAIVIIGGLGSLAGAIIVGFTLGIVESFATLYMSSGSMNMLVFGAMIAVLLFRPLGLFGRQLRL